MRAYCQLEGVQNEELLKEQRSRVASDIRGLKV